jgi:hypothetical protein
MKSLLMMIYVLCRCPMGMFSESYFVPMCHTLCPFHDHFPVIFPALVHVYNDLGPLRPYVFM